MSNWETVWKYLQRYGKITTKKIEQLTGTTCPHDTIRKIRQRFGYDCLNFEDRLKTKKVKKNGKIVKHSTTYRIYFLKLMED